MTPTPMRWSAEPTVVALGGGHGLAASLGALRQVTTDLTAVVTVADNGGSSGRLREEFGVLPPGDLRMALAALCGDDRWGQTWARVLQHRFDSQGPLAGHSTGNLLIVTLWELLGDHVDGLDWVAGLLGARGRVLPMAVHPLDISAEVRGAGERSDEVTTVRGQVEVASTAGEVLSVNLVPEGTRACPDAVAAVSAADWVVLGPGSWFTSVIPHLLLPDLRAALSETSGRVVVSLNLEPHTEETKTLSLAEHLDVLARHAPEVRVHAVVADAAAVRAHPEVRDAADRLGARLEVADVAAAEPGVHDPRKLAAAYARLFARD